MALLFLTYLYNKVAFYDKVKNYIKENKEDNCTLIFIDLDNFKAVNDNLGHMVGDEVLKDTANKISDVFKCKQVRRTRLLATN